MATHRLFGPVYSDATTKPAIEAVAATERSMPPVSMTNV